jgi:hypothetical protein
VTTAEADYPPLPGQHDLQLSDSTKVGAHQATRSPSPYAWCVSPAAQTFVTVVVVKPRLSYSGNPAGVAPR